jgi:hypothetical protein
VSVPSSVGRVPVKLFWYSHLYPHATAAISPQPGDGACVQARWVRASHAQVGQRSQRAQLCGQRARETNGAQRPALPKPPPRSAHTPVTAHASRRGWVSTAASAWPASRETENLHVPAFVSPAHERRRGSTAIHGEVV